MAIKLFDSLTRETRELRASHSDGIFRFYNCGPTVYAPAHIGNFRTFVVNDVLRRLLELEFGAAKVKHVRNLTDVDDKTIKRARDEGRPLAEVTKQWTDKFHADCAALNCLPPHEEPRAADPQFIREQVNMIDVLMEKGNAYRTPDGSVFFKVSSFEGYGALSRVKERELKLGVSQKNTAFDDEKDDVSDFALWKAWRPEDGPNKWDGPNGASAGRPGWHIECSAMSKAILGKTIDLHTGGVDLLFPHHENEIAQSECCNGQQFSKHWYHSEHLLVDGKKMSKSLGNLYTLDQLKEMGHSPMALRYALLSGHPRKQLNFTLDSLHAAEASLRNLESHARFLCEKAGISFEQFCSQAAALRPRIDAGWKHLDGVFSALTTDLNIPAARGELFSWLGTVRLNILNSSKFTREELNELLDEFAQVLSVLGLDLTPPAAPKAEVPAAITALAAKRWAAKQAKDFAAADALRKELTAAGWSMLDSKTDYKLEPLKKQ